jgi:hypothetical protein
LTEPTANKCGPPATSSGAYLGEIQLTVGLTPKSQEDKDQVGHVSFHSDNFLFFLNANKSFWHVLEYHICVEKLLQPKLSFELVSSLICVKLFDVQKLVGYDRHRSTAIISSDIKSSRKMKGIAN